MDEFERAGARDELPLSGITVLSLEQAIAAPLCTRHLADLGARVIKLERPQGGDFARHYDDRVRGLASHFVWVNRSKESLALDLKSELAERVLARLLPRCDVFVQNLGPGATERLGLDYASLHVRFPRMIVCNISGYGSTGPYRDKKAYDLVIQAESGFLSVTGTNLEPTKAGCSIADISAGMHAFSATLAALLRRHKSGKGSCLNISMFDTMVDWMGYPMYYAFDGASPPLRTGASHASIYPYGPFRVGDGGTVVLGLQNDREWSRFCNEVLNQPELERDERFNSNVARVRNRTTLQEIIEVAFAVLSIEAVVSRLDKAGIANGRINDMSAVWTHPQLLARNSFAIVQTEAGSIPALRPSWLPSDIDPVPGRIPALGEHTDQILRELGLQMEHVDGTDSTNAIR